MSVHRDDAEQGLLEIIKKEQELEELFLVHRLDKVTSGLLLLAKNSTANRELSLLFQNRAVEKYYLALSDRRPKKKQGLIIGDMEKSRRGTWKLLTTRKNPAITQFFSQAVPVPFSGPGRLYLLKPKSGKTHQLRVALKSIGAPILGDSDYYPAATEHVPVDRAYLHSYVLAFHYQTNHYRFVCAPSQGELFTSGEFQAALQKYSEPWLLPWPAL